MADNNQEFKISLGVELRKTDLDIIKEKMKKLTNKISSEKQYKITFKSDFSNVQKQINSIKKQIENLGKIKINLGGDFVPNGKGGSRGVRAGASTGKKKQGQTDDVIKAYNDIIKLQQRMNTARTSLVGLDSKKDAKQIVHLTQLIDTLSKKYSILYDIFSKEFTMTQMENLDFSIDKTVDRMDILTKKSQDAKTNLMNTFQQKLSSNQFDTEISNVEAKFNNLSVKTKSLSDEIVALKGTYSEMKASFASKDFDTFLAKYEEYQQLISKVGNQVKILTNDEKEATRQQKLMTSRETLSNKISIWLQQNSAAAKQFGSKLKELQKELENCDPKRLEEIKGEFQGIITQATLAGKNTKTFGDRLKESFRRLSSYFSITTIFFQAARAIRSMYENVKKLDSAMTNLYKVTDETAERYESFISNAAKNSKELGRSMDSFVEQAANWAKLGYSLEEAESLAKLSSIYANVAEVSDDVAVADMVSAMKAFNIETQNAVTIVDAFNELGNKFAVSAAGIGEGLKKSASSLAAAGTDMYHAIALITGGSEITQNAGEFGSFLKVASMRVRGMKGELEELGEEVDENVESISKMQTKILNLTKGKVNIFDARGDFKDYYEIIEDISKVVDHISSTEKADLYETLFGKLRANQGAALIQAFQSGQVQKAYDVAIKSAGSAYAEQEKWMNSIEAKIGQLDTAWQNLSQTFLTSDFLKSLIDGLSGFVNILTVAIDKMGSLPLILGTISAVSAGVFGKGIFNGELFKNASAQIKNYNLMMNESTEAVNSYIVSLENVNPAMARYLKTLNGGSASLAGYTKNLTRMTLATVKATAKIVALQTVIGIGVGAVISGITFAIGKLVEAVKESSKPISEKLEELKEDINDANTEIEGTVKNFKNLTESTNNVKEKLSSFTDKVSKFGDTTKLSNEENKEFADICNTLAKLFPELVIGYDEAGNSVLYFDDGIQGLIEDIDTLVKKSQFESQQKIAETLPEIFEKSREEIALYEDELNRIIDLLNRTTFQTDIRSNFNEFKSMLAKYGVDYTTTIGNSYAVSISYSEEDRAKLNRVIEQIKNDFNNKIESASKRINPIISSWLKTDFDYQGFDVTIQEAINRAINNLDIDITEQFDTAEDFQNFISEKIVNPLKNNEEVREAIKELFSMDEKDISAYEYITRVKDLLSDIALGSEKDESIIEKYLGFEDFENEYIEMITFISSKTKKSVDVINRYSIPEISRMFDLIKNYGIRSWDDLLYYMENNTLSNVIDVKLEKEGFDLVSSAVKDSSSAIGISAENVEKLKQRYSEIKVEGIPELFEKTRNGISLNTDALRKLEDEYIKIKKSEYNQQLKDQIDIYNNLTNTINELADGEEKENKIRMRQDLESQIKEVRNLISEYEGLTSVFNKWKKAQETPNEGSMYDSLVSDLKKIQELYEKGLVGTDDFREAVQLMTNIDVSDANVDQLVEIYKDSFSKMQRYLTEGSEGVTNLLNDIMALDEGWVTLSDDGKWSIDIPDIGAVAERLGVNAETISIAFRKLADYGFVNDFNEIEESQSKVEKSSNNINSEFENAIDNIGEIIDSSLTFEEKISSIKNLMKETFEIGDVDLASRPQIKFDTTNFKDLYEFDKQELEKAAKEGNKEYADYLQKELDALEAGNEIATVYSSTFFKSDFMDLKEGELDSAVVLTPILPDGSVLSPKELEAYAKKVLSGEEIEPNITLGFFEDKDELGNFEENLHLIQEIYYNLINVSNQESKPSVDIEGNALDASRELLKNLNELDGKVVTVTINAKGETSLLKNNKEDNNSGKYSSFAKGTSGTKNNGMALVGENGPEILARDGFMYILGENSAEMFNYKKDDIIFDAKQSEQILKNGKISSGKKRGKSFAYGRRNTILINDGGSRRTSEFISSGNIPNVEIVTESGKKGGGGSSREDKEFKEKIDWIEVAIDRIERKISKLGKVADSIYRTWEERNSSLKKQISTVTKEIDLQSDAYERYIKESESIGLDEKYAKLVREGTIDIETITDEQLKDKIDEYSQWYDKAIDCKDAILDLQETESELYQQSFENVIARYDSIISEIEFNKNLIDEYISQSEAKGQITSTEYYKSLIDAETSNIEQLEKERRDLINSFNEAVSSGSIKEGSQAWYDMKNDINDVTLEIEKANTSIIEYNNSIRDINWEIFDLIQEKISGITEESDFLIELMSNKKLVGEKGGFTDVGSAVIGLHGQNYNVYMKQAEEYAKEIQKIEEEIAKDPNNKELVDRKKELIELQRESILASNSEKDAIIDLVKEAIEAELNALQELINKRKESLDAEKESYEYNKKVRDQTEEIASLQKQLASYAGDTSEESRLKMQKLQASLEKAQESLRETEYDKYISDQKELMDNLYSEYEEILNQRLDNVDALLTDIVNSVNDNANKIYDTIVSETENVGIKLSDTMNSIWGTGAETLSYGSMVSNSFTSIDSVLKEINIHMIEMLDFINKEAKDKIDSINGGYKNGAYRISSNRNSWTQEGRNREVIVRPSDGAILTPLASGDSVLSASATSNIWDMANNPEKFIMDNLKPNSSIITTNNGIGNNYDNKFNVSVVLPNVMNYDDFKHAMKNDSNFEKFIRSITVDRMFGGSSLKKYRY